MRRTHPRRLARRAMLAAALPAALAAVALPSAAQAASVGVDTSQGVLLYSDAGEHESHQISVFDNGGRIRIADTQPLDTKFFLGDDCFNVDSRTVSCSLAGVSRVKVEFGNGNDLVNPTVSLPVTVTGGGGSDRLLSGHAPGASRVDFAGGAGHDIADYGPASAGVVVAKGNGLFDDGRQNRDHDRIQADVEEVRGSSFNDSINGDNELRTEILAGGPGTDIVSGNDGTNLYDMGSVADGADTIRGGSGRDHADYSKRTKSITATLSLTDGNDGEAGERDSLRSVESISAGSAGSTMSAPFGSRASYTLIGGAGVDTLTGAEGADTILPLGARDTVDAKGGNDTISARDGLSDFVLCGSGLDTSTLDVIDTRGGCE
jgi:Ca2+-binding RTX toxin-like protein